MSAEASVGHHRRGGLSPMALDDLSAVAGVMRAGARARAVVEGYEAAGVAAILLDGFGRVLHVGRAAEELLGGSIRVEAGHVLGRDAAANAAIEAVLNPILGSADATAPFSNPVVVAAGDPSRLALSAIPYRDDLPGQLLRAVLFLARESGASDERLAA